MVIQLSRHILIPKRYQEARSMSFWHQGEWAGVSKADSLKQWLFLAVLSLWTTRQKPVGEHDGSCVLFYTRLIKMTLVGEKGKNVRLWHQLQTTVWDKSVIPMWELQSFEPLNSFQADWFKLWLMEQNKRPVFGTSAEAHQTRPNWTRKGLVWWYNRARNYQGLFQYSVVLYAA